MKCQQCVEFLSDYLDDLLAADVKGVFEGHLQGCPPCLAYLKTYQTGSELARAALANDCCDVPEELVAAILTARRTVESQGS